MPTYEYECVKCSFIFERFQNMSDDPLKRCPKCRCKVKRLPGRGAGIIFKGSGFYETDYRNENYKKEVKKEKDNSNPKKETKKNKDNSNTSKNKVTKKSKAGD